MNKREQRLFALTKKKRAEARLRKSLASLFNEIAANYRLGDRTMKDDDRADLFSVLRKFYTATARDVVGFDFRQRKQEVLGLFDEVADQISRDAARQIETWTAQAGGSIVTTVNRMITRATLFAISEQLSEGAATKLLGNTLRNHSIIIATTEAQFVEKMRRLVIMRVNDPLGNSLQRMLNLIRLGEWKEARALSDEVVRLARLPLSLNQGTVVQKVNDIREHIVNPYRQAETIDSIEQMGAQLGRQMKEWMTVMDDKVRASHAAVDGVTLPFDEPFVLEGGMMQEPHDTTLGADLSEIISCRCCINYI